MSLSQVREFTEKHRKAQLVLRAATLRDLLKLWPAFDINDISRTWPVLEEATMLLIQGRGRTSSGLASAYYRRARLLSGVSGGTEPILAKVLTDKAVAGLRIVGPLNAQKQLLLGRNAIEVARATLVNISGETTRHVLNAGRETVDLTVKADERAIGWRRITSGSACDFCRMLAGRGAVYKSETVRFSAHGHCACFPQPEFE